MISEGQAGCGQGGLVVIGDGQADSGQRGLVMVSDGQADSGQKGLVITGDGQADSGHKMVSKSTYSCRQKSAYSNGIASAETFE